MLVYSLLLSIALSVFCSAHGDHHGNPPVAMTMGAAQSPDQSGVDPGSSSSTHRLLDLVQDQKQEALWREKILDLMTQLVLVQKEASKNHVQVVQLLGMLENQGSQQIQDLQNMARHQSLLVENHQALLLQTSRIATNLQELTKKPAATSQ